jgi:hypothetical protein
MTLVPTYQLGGNSAFLEIGVVHTGNRPEKFERGIVLKQIFANQCSGLAESNSLVTKICSINVQV